MELAKWMASATWHTYVQRDCMMSRQQLQRLGEHKYSATDISWLDELCMKRLIFSHSSRFLNGRLKSKLLA